MLILKLFRWNDNPYFFSLIGLFTLVPEALFYANSVVFISIALKISVYILRLSVKINFSMGMCAITKSIRVDLLFLFGSIIVTII